MTATRVRRKAPPDRRPLQTRRRPAPPAKRPPPEPTESGTGGLGAGGALPSLLKAAGAVIAPTTVLTGLLFYFGRLHAASFFGYFRVNFTALDLTSNDYLIRSADGLFVPVAVFCVAGLFWLWAHRLVVDRLSPVWRQRILTVAPPLAGVAGAVLVGFALVTLTTRNPPVILPPESGGLALSLGAVLLVYAVGLSRLSWYRKEPAPRRGSGAIGVAEWAFTFLLVTIGLFWAVSSYANGVGRGRAVQQQEALPTSPDAVLYSEKGLGLSGTGITEERCQDPQAAFGFRYVGLKLVLQVGDHYLFLPGTWTPESGTAVLISRTDAIRLEFRAAGQSGGNC